jgi:protein gp37
MSSWNPWHGCKKISPGCLNCYVYRIDSRHDRDASVVRKTQSFDLPVRRKRDGSYKLPPGDTVWTCFTSDFLLDTADIWRTEAWDMMRERRDLSFFFITKRIDRLELCLPPDWGDGWEHVHICCTVENQAMADYRLPIYIEAPIKHKAIICEPLLEKIELSRWLRDFKGFVLVGGESGINARMCDYDWVLDIHSQCIYAGVPFRFKQTGANFRKDGIIYRIPRSQQHLQARKASIDTY